ncbi:MAG: ATP-binding protein [Nanoarchaeota archaeon]|nr:ATP-binding protein [Nanoarchaeota archaeon]
MQIEDLNPWWKTSNIEEGFRKMEQRDAFHTILKYLKDRQIICITGLRRTGKTVLMHHLISHMIKEIPKESVLYYNFDLLDESIENILKQYGSKVKIDIKKERIFVFLDEVQKHKNWENELKLLYDNFLNIKFLVSGSSSLFIEKKTKESLGGRAFSFMLEPMRFAEYSRIAGFKYDEERLTLYKGEIEKAFGHYLSIGGFPELIGETDPEKIGMYVKELVVDKIIYMDIPQAFKIDEPELLSRIFMIISSSPGMIFDYGAIASDLQRNRKTISNYVSYLEKAFLIKKIYNYSKNLLTSEKKLKKIYPVSTAFAYFANAEPGKIIETAVLMNSDFRYFSRKGDKEVDFVKAEKGAVIPVEVKYAGRIRIREFKGLLKFMRDYGLKEGLAITKEHEAEENVSGFKVKFVPIWKWMLKNRRSKLYIE